MTIGTTSGGGMTWGELKAQVASRGISDDTILDAVDMYSPQAGEVVSIDVHPFGVVIQTRDIDDLSNGVARGKELYCVRCRDATFSDPRPRLIAQYRER
jgi:hypothetical protein